MKPDGRLRLLVISDLHAYENLGTRVKPPSALHMSGADKEVDRLFEGVKVALDSAGFGEIDAVICPGDITDRAEIGALVQVWQRLQALAQQVGAPLFATAGNHDFASHPDHEVIDPKETLLDLEPLFPAADAEAHRDYFAFNVAKVDIPNARFVLVNSCATHGLVHGGANEYEHGRVSKSTVKRIKDCMAAEPRPTLNILVTHHHPVQLPYFDTDERSQIVDGGLLLKALEDDAPWLIIHGHKHRPWLHYAQGGGGSPAIFSAGSFAADLGGDSFGGSLRNQFYLIELLSPAESAALELGVAGTVTAWSRTPYAQDAWAPAGPSDGMASVSGFGWRASPPLIARRLEAWLASQKGTVTNDELVAWEPRIPYLTPNDFDQVVSELSRGGRFRIKLDNYGRFTGIDVTAGGAA